MKKLLLFISILFIAAFAKAQDTIEIEIDEKTKVVLYVQDKESLQKIKALDLNQIVRDALKELGESSETDQKITYKYEVVVAKNDDSKIELTPAGKKETDYFNIGMNKEEEGLNISTNKTSFKSKKLSKNSFSFWTVDLGVNNYLNKDGKFPDETGEPYRLRTINSTYVGVGVHLRQKIGESPFSIQAGLSMDWYNFKFQGDNYIAQGTESVEFRDYSDDFSKSIKKSKLVVNYVNIPVMLNARFKDKNGDRTFNFGIGGYAGYRINSYGKINEGGNKDKTHDSFYLNNLRYGVEVQAGYRNLLLFAKYDLNPLFNTDKGPELNVMSFGIRL